MSIEIRNFQQGDAGKIESTRPHDIDRDAYRYTDMEKFGRTMLEHGEPIATWGMQPDGDGVATVWAEFSERALSKYPVAVAKNVKRHLEEHIESLGLRRVRSMIFAGDDVSIHWIKWLGFHLEGPERHLKDMDVLIYARQVD